MRATGVFAMLRLVLLTVAAAVLAAPAYASAFCDGFAAGYKAGYCYQQYGCIPPIPPICPIPNIGESTFQDGYNRGFLAGQAAR